MRVLLYTREGCELCDNVVQLFEQLKSDELAVVADCDLTKVDIAQDAELTERYGLAIPVLEREDNGEQLFWPFPPSRLREFLRRGGFGS